MFEIDRLVRKNIQNLEPYSSARDEFSGLEGTFLDANESPFGELNRYPDPNQRKLKSILAEFNALDSNQIFVGNGSDEVIDLLFRIFCEPNQDKVLTFTPTYGMYKVSAALNAVEIVEVALNDAFDIDLELAKEALNDGRVKLTFICSPNNPTGNALSRHSIEEILSISRGIVVVDEAYIDFSSTQSLTDLINTYPNLVVTQTMSKAKGLAAARVGFAFANSKIITLFNRVKPPYNVSALNQSAAIATLLNSAKVKENVELILSERKKLRDQLSKLDFVSTIYPSDSNFLLVEFENANEVYDELIKRKIIVRNRTQLVRNCIRITVGKPLENKLLIEELKQIEDEKSAIYR